MNQGDLLFYQVCGTVFILLVGSGFMMFLAMLVWQGACTYIMFKDCDTPWNRGKRRERL